MERLAQDLRYAIRTFLGQPGFALTAIAALALGIGANTAVFSVVYSVLLKPLPYPDPAALIYVHDTYPAVTFASVSAAKYVALRDGNRSLEALGATTPAALTLTGHGEAERVGGSRVSADMFTVMQVPTYLGRPFSREEDLPNAPPVIVLSHALWQRRYGADRGIVGSAIVVDGISRTVVGVMPPGFTYPGATQAWIPLGIPPAIAPGGNFLRLVGRMRAGVTVDQVQQDLASVSNAFNETNKLLRDVKVWPLHQFAVTDSRNTLLVLQGAVAFVLLVACANVANLLLARSVQRQREFAIRSAMGASRRRLFRQLLTESVLLSAIGGAAGVLLASWLLRLFISQAPANVPRLQSIAIDARVLAFTFVIAVLTGLLFGLAPARRGFRADPNESLRLASGRGTTSGGRRGASRALVIAEVAMALTLVIGAGLMVKSLLKLQRERSGFDPNGLLTFELNLPPARYADIVTAAFVGRVLDEIRSVPGVRSAGAINHIPLVTWGFNGGFSIEGRPPFPADTAPVVEFRMVTPGYFSTMGIPIRLGQDFSESDTASGRPVVIVNEVMAQRYWPNESPIGARLQLSLDDDDVVREVIGVVGDVRSARMRQAPIPETYVPHQQVPNNSMGFAVRTEDANPAIVMPAIRERIRAADADLPLVRVRPMTAIVAASTGDTRMSSALTSVFALVAALLAAVGIYSLIAYSVAQRTREIGIRVALGADRRAVIRMVIGEGLLLGLSGVAFGIAGSVLLTRFMTSMLYEVEPTDPAVLAMTCAGVLAVACLASIVPALRALRVDPAIALRAE